MHNMQLRQGTDALADSQVDTSKKPVPHTPPQNWRNTPPIL